MEASAVTGLRTELVAALAASTDRLRSTIRGELDKGITLEAGRQLQFEIDDFFFGITLCANEESILPGEWLDGALPKDWFDRAEQAEVDWNAIIIEELCPWFAGCWQAVGGPGAFSPAYLFFHLRPQEQYDLEGRRWVSFGT
ncbi:MAG TPA: hypothetical protein VMU16_00285 [Candidatus Binataceae bacterium]|nr:hypothetical protein [Candidatus Binataceae bacterium]